MFAFKKMRLLNYVLDHMLDYMLDHVLDHIIIGLVTMALNQQTKIIDKKKFVKPALDKNIKAFVIHISFLSLGLKITIYLV